MDTPVQFNKQIRPICLPSTSQSFAGKTATVIGWGSLRESNYFEIFELKLHRLTFQ